MKRQLSNWAVLFTAMTTMLAMSMASAVRRVRPAASTAADRRDRGAVSLEQVLWFVAAGVAVAVIAGIVWSKIRDQANTDPVVPAAP